MKPFFNARRTRYTTAVMLFVWLMSLGIGLANACLARQGDAGPDYFNPAHSGMTSEALTGHDVTLDRTGKVQVHADENVPSPEKSACVNFCAAEQNTLIKDQAGGPTAQAMVPVLFLTRLLMPAADQTCPPQAFASPNGSEPPVSIRYLRLTI